MFSPDELLSKTSRTFALAIPYLPEPTRREVSIAYLLLRIGDTLEDGTRWAAAQRATELRCYSSLLRAASPEAARALASRWLRDPPLDDEAYLELVAALPAVVTALSGLA